MKRTVYPLLLAGVFSTWANAASPTIQHSFNEGNDAQVINLAESLPKEQYDSDTARYYALSLMSKDLDDAEEAAELAITQFPNDYKLYLTHATIMGAQASDSIFSALGYAEKALKSLEKAVEIAPDNYKAYTGLLGFHLNAPSIAGGDLEQAEQLVAKIKSLDEEAGAQAELRLANAKDSEVGEMIEQAIADYPQSLSMANYAASYHNREENYAQALAYYQKMLDIAGTTEWSSAKETQDETEMKLAQTRLLSAHYQFGKLAIEFPEHYHTGIAYLRHYVTNRDSADVIRRDLPSLNWANLRLAELLLNNQQLDDAKSVFAAIKMEDDKRFKKIHKQVKKRL